MRRLFLMLAVLAAAGVGGWLWWRASGERVAPPVIDLSGEDDPGLEAAVADARQRVVKEPRSAEAWGYMGELLLANGFGADARPCFAQAGRLAPKDVRWPYLHGLAQQPINPDDAVADFRKAAELAGEGQDGDVVRWRYGEALMRKGRREEAEAVLRGVADDPRAVLALGILAADARRFEAAREYLERCTRSPLTQQRATARLAMLMQEMKDPPAADRYRRRAKKLPRDPEGPDQIAEEYKGLLIGRRARLLRAEYLLRDGTRGAAARDEAIALLRQLLEEHPDEPEASVKLGMALLEAGNPGEAEQVLREGLRHGERVQARFFLCVALFDRGRYEGSAEQARLVLATKPDHALAHLYLGLSLNKLDKPGEALRKLAQAVRYSPESVDPHLHYGEALVATGEAEKGLAELKRAAELAGDGDGRPRAVLERLGKGLMK